MTAYFFLYFESFALLFIFLKWHFSSGPKKLVDYKIIQITVPDNYGNVLIKVKRINASDYKKLIITKALMDTGSYKLEALLSLSE